MWLSNRRTLGTIAVTLVLGSSLLALTGWADGHSGSAIDAFWASTIPTIDGAMDSGEWADASLVDLGAIPGNLVPAFLLLKNNASFLWIAYDATGDETEESFDVASVAFDTNHDGVATDGEEDQFVQGGWVNNNQSHWVYSFSVGGWIEEDSPYDEGLPNHPGLQSAWGFGASDRSTINHRIYEFRIPLALLGAAPGDTLGFFGGSWPAPGVFDATVSGWSTWPEWVPGPIPLVSYGDLTLDTAPGPVGVSITPPSATATGLSGRTVAYNLTVRHKGTTGNDTFDITTASSWPLTLWDASGSAPLTDTDSDGLPDTGNLSIGAFVGIVVEVSIPSNMTGCSTSVITATSSRNTNISDASTLETCTIPAGFLAPHSDFGLDSDDDSLFDYLVVNASLQVDEAGMYLVEGFLRDPTFTLSLYTSNLTSLDVGLQTVPLWFDGVRINASDVDGPYSVELRLHDYATFTFLDEDTYTTAAYSHLDFEGPPASFAPPHSDFGLDSDGDGLFDYLVVNASLQVDEAGMYLVDAVLYDPTFTLFVYTSNLTSLDVGLQTVPLWFDGVPINASGVDGPYTVDFTLYDYPTFAFLDADTHTTAAYSHLAFKGPVPMFRIGTILPLTGILGFIGGSMKDAADLAAADINAAGGVLGIMLELLHRDSRTDPFDGLIAAEELVFGEGVPVIVGAASSGVSLPVADVTIPNEVVQISPASTSPVFTSLEPEEPGWFWRTAASDALQGRVAAMRAIEKGWTSVGVLALNNPYGRGLADAFRERFTGDGRNVVQVNYTEARPDYTSDLQLIADAAPDAVFFIGYPGDGLTIMQNWWASKDQPGWNWNWLFSEGLRSADFLFDLQSAGIDVSGAEGIAPVLEGPNYEAFRTEYLNQYGREPEIFAAHTYDAVYLTALAAIAGQAGDSLTIRDNLINVANPPGTVIGPGPGEFERAVGILEAGGEIDYEGASSRVNFDQVGDVGSSFEVWQVTQDHQIAQLDVIPESQIWPPSPDNTPPTMAILSPLAGAILPTGDVFVSWSAGDFESGIDRIEVRLDGGMPVVPVATETSHTFTGVADGSHTITATAFDSAGNSQIASVDFTVDATPPEVSITSPSPEAFVDASNVELTWTATDVVSGIDRFEVTLDGGTPLVLSSTANSHAFADVSDGAHTVNVTAVDRAGNARTVLVSVTVDTVPPMVSISSPLPDAIVTSIEVQVTWVGVDATAGIDHFEVSLNGGAAMTLPATATNHVFSGVGDGPHTITVTAVDRAGNSAAASVDVTVDTNLFSPTGPFGSLLLVAIPAAIAAVAVAIFLFFWLRKRAASPPP